MSAVSSRYAYAKKSMELTSLAGSLHPGRFNSTPDKYGYTQNLFPIADSTYKRPAYGVVKSSLQECNGNAIGRLSVGGEPVEMMYEYTELCCGILRNPKNSRLMGVGTPWNDFKSIALGVDMFDSRDAHHQ